MQKRQNTTTYPDPKASCIRANMARKYEHPTQSSLCAYTWLAGTEGASEARYRVDIGGLKYARVGGLGSVLY